MTHTQLHKGNLDATKSGKQTRHMSDSMQKHSVRHHMKDNKNKGSTDFGGTDYHSSNAGAGTQSDNNNQ